MRVEVRTTERSFSGNIEKGPWGPQSYLNLRAHRGLTGDWVNGVQARIVEFHFRIVKLFESQKGISSLCPNKDPLLSKRRKGEAGGRPPSPSPYTGVEGWNGGRNERVFRGMVPSGSILKGPFGGLNCASEGKGKAAGFCHACAGFHPLLETRGQQCMSLN